VFTIVSLHGFFRSLFFIFSFKSVLSLAPCHSFDRRSMKRMKSNMLSYLLCVVLLFGYSLGQDDVVFSRGQKFQIILMGTPDASKMPLPPTDAPVWDIDLFDSDAATINTLKIAGKIVICYFSAGPLEDWRDCSGRGKGATRVAKRKVDQTWKRKDQGYHGEADQAGFRQGVRCHRSR
jgi:hypothetical protein